MSQLDDEAPAEDAATKSAPPTRTASRMQMGAIPTERSRNFRTVVRRFLRLLGTERLRVGLIVMLSIAAVFCNVLGPKVLGRATDVIIRGVFSGLMDAGRLHRILFEAIALYGTSAALGILSSYVLSGVVQRMMLRLRGQAEDKINVLPLNYVDHHARGDLLSRVTNDIDNIAQSLQQTMSQILASVLMLIGVTLMMFTISPLLALVALVCVPISVFTMNRVGRRARPRFVTQWRTTGMLNAQIEEAFTGHAIVKAFGQQRQVEERFAATNDELHAASFGAQFFSSIMQPLTMFFGNVQYVIVAVVGGLRVQAGAITVGEIQAFIQYSRTFTMPLTQLASMLNIFQSGMASLERVLEFLDAEEQSPDVASVGPTAAPRGRVAFEHVRFSYQPETPLIEDLSLVAEPGQTIAIVGPTGAGKTTLVNLLMRFYELDGGRITLDGADIATMPRSELRLQMGMVLQDTWLFGGTIRENILYGNPAATEEDLLDAARATYVDRFVRALPDGYETVINDEGDNVSAGEKQLLTIARAFLSDPLILILDEATSSVDTRTEVLIQEAMNRLRASRTSFVIAHRLSTIRGADVILVMENGAIVEQGSHTELLAREGAYFRLYQAQFSAAVTEVEEDGAVVD
jgi:ATP-binding cassette subfamily B multidrug efflux pump